jgi:hypothetical protein
MRDLGLYDLVVHDNDWEKGLNQWNAKLNAASDERRVHIDLNRYLDSNLLYKAWDKVFDGAR